MNIGGINAETRARYAKTDQESGFFSDPLDSNTEQSNRPSEGDLMKITETVDKLNDSFESFARIQEENRSRLHSFLCYVREENQSKKAAIDELIKSSDLVMEQSRKIRNTSILSSLSDYILRLFSFIKKVFNYS